MRPQRFPSDQFYSYYFERLVVVAQCSVLGRANAAVPFTKTRTHLKLLKSFRLFLPLIFLFDVIEKGERELAEGVGVSRLRRRRLDSAADGAFLLLLGRDGGDVAARARRPQPIPRSLA